MRRALAELRGLLESGPCLLGSWLCVAGCGDIGDAEVPYPLHGSGSRELPRYERLEPAGLAPPAQAVVSLTATPIPDGACPLDIEASLPDASASSTLTNGAGPRAVDGAGSTIECRVAPRLFSGGVFDVDLGVRDERLQALLVTGEVGPRSGVVTLQLDAPDGSSLAATCPVEADELLDGAVWFHSIGCQAQTDEAGGGRCDVSLRAIFENCSQ